MLNDFLEVRANKWQKLNLNLGFFAPNFVSNRMSSHLWKQDSSKTKYFSLIFQKFWKQIFSTITEDRSAHLIPLMPNTNRANRMKKKINGLFVEWAIFFSHDS